MRNILLVGLLALYGCAPGPDELPCSNVDVGQTVTAKIDGRRGMVTSMYMHQPAVWVRFPGVQIDTDTHTLGPDGPVTVGPYADVYMRCFEIEPAK